MTSLTYEVTFKGSASPSLRGAFDEDDVRTGGGRTTVRCAPPRLTTVLDHVQSLGLELLDVRLVVEAADDDPI